MSLCGVGGVALAEAPELRWYANGLLGNSPWLVSLLGRPSAAATPSFTGFYAPSNYLVVLLEVFAVLLIACAVAAEYVGLIVERLNAYTLIARGEAQRGQELWATLIEQLPLPAFLVDAATLTVVNASESAGALLGGDEPPAGRPLFEMLRFTYPDAVQELLKGADGEAPMNVIRIADEVRLARVRVLHVAHQGRRLALMIIEDMTETFCLKAALDTSEYAALVIDSRGKIMTFNERATGVLGIGRAGMAAAQLLPPLDAGLPWWDPGLTGRRKLHLVIGSRIYLFTSWAVRLPGETEPVFSVSILPFAERVAGDPATGATTILNARQLR